MKRIAKPPSSGEQVLQEIARLIKDHTPREPYTSNTIQRIQWEIDDYEAAHPGGA